MTVSKKKGLKIQELFLDLSGFLKPACSNGQRDQEPSESPRGGSPVGGLPRSSAAGSASRNGEKVSWACQLGCCLVLQGALDPNGQAWMTTKGIYAPRKELGSLNGPQCTEITTTYVQFLKATNENRKPKSVPSIQRDPEDTLSRHFEEKPRPGE